MKSKCLCVLAIDSSGSMLNKHGESNLIKIDLLNELLTKFIDKLKSNPLIADKLEICIIEIRDTITVRIQPTPILGVKVSTIDTISGKAEIGLGIEKSLNIIGAWKFKNSFGQLLKNNHLPYLILVTDLAQKSLLEEEQQHPFKSKIELITSKRKAKFYGIGIGGAQLVNFFNRNENLYVTNEPDFTLFFNNLNQDLSIELQKSRPQSEDFAVILKWSKSLFFFIKKYYFLFFLFFSIPFCSRTIKSRGVSIKIDKLVEVNKTEIKNYENVYPDNEINITIEPEGWLEDNIKFVYDFTYNIENYELGAYMTNSSDEVDLSSKILLASLQNLGQNFKIAGEVYIKVIGETDAVPINNVIYRGELGAIKDKKFHVNGQWLEMTINDYEKLDRNIQLAFLRGYSVWDLMRRNCDFIISQKSHFQQVVKTNDNSNKIGGIYRRIKVEMILYDVESITRAKVEPLLD